MTENFGTDYLKDNRKKKFILSFCFSVLSKFSAQLQSFVIKSDLKQKVIAFRIKVEI